MMHGVTKDVILSSGGAYSGVSKAMLLAGGKQADRCDPVRSTQQLKPGPLDEVR